MTSVQIRAVCKAFGKVTVVDHLDLEVPAGALATLLGASGCGKTTTLRMVAGLERPASGEICIGGETVCGPRVFVPPEQRQIGMVFQSYAIWPHMTVFENVAYPLRVRRVGGAGLRRRVTEALRMVQLDHLIARYPSQLSGGQQQRVALARALVFEPQVLLLDEPLSNLDAKLREEMRVEIRDVQRRLGITTLYVTHDQHEALAVSDVVAVMDRGRLVQVGSPTEVYERPQSRFVAGFLGWSNLLEGVVADSRHVRMRDALLACVVPDGIAAGAVVYLAIRSRHVEFAQAGGPNVLPVTVRAQVYAGDYVDYRLDSYGQELQARVPIGTGADAATDGHVRLDPTRILVLPA